MNNAVSMTFTNKVSGSNLTKYAEKLERLKKVMESMPSSVVLDSNSIGNISKAETMTNKFKNTINSANKNTKNINNTLLKSAGFVAFTKALDKTLTNMFRFTSKSADYVENLNLMNVAFHRTEDSISDANLEGIRFVNTLSEMYGLDESALTRTVGNFKQLANAMGIADDLGTKLSKTLTQMSIDISSLYNVDFEKATQVLQSSIAGQTKPIRGLAGADITETTLQLTLDTYGIEATVRELSYVEKRLLIVTSLMDQLKESQNDYGRTIESVANQMRIFNEQTERLKRALGNMFLPILQQVLPYLNAFLMVLTEIVNWIARLLGYDEDLFSGFSSGIGDITNDFLDLGNSLDNANNSAKKLKQGLRGFDKLNVITTPSSGSGNVGVGSGINPKIMEAFNKSMKDYENRLEKVQMKATKIRDNIMEWLGFTKEVDEETGKVSFKFDHITGGTVLGALVVGGTIFKGISGIFGMFKGFKNILFPNVSKQMALPMAEASSKNIYKYLSNIALIGGSLATIGYVGYNIAKDTKELTNNVKDISESNKESIKKPLDNLIDSYKNDVTPSLEEVLNMQMQNANRLSATYDLIEKTSIFGDKEFGYSIDVLKQNSKEYDRSLDFTEKILKTNKYNKKELLEILKSLEESQDNLRENKRLYESTGRKSSEINDTLKKGSNLISYIKYDLLEMEIPEYVKSTREIERYTNKIKEENSKNKKSLSDILTIMGDLFDPTEKIRNSFGNTRNIIIKTQDTLSNGFESATTKAGTFVDKLYEKITGKKFDFKLTSEGEELKSRIESIGTSLSNLFDRKREININTNKIIDDLSLLNSKISSLLPNVWESLFGGTKFDSYIKNIAIKLKDTFSIFNVFGENSGLSKIAGAVKDWSKNIMSKVINAPRLKTGMDFVPKDFYGPVYLDYGERVLTKEENQRYSNGNNFSTNFNNNKQPINATFIIKVGDEEVARKVLYNLEDMASANGKPITIGG